MLLPQLAQVEQFLLKLRLRGVVVSQNRREGTRDESEGRNACKHDENAENSLQSGARGQVSVADCRNSGHDEVAAHDVKVDVFHVVEVGIPHPGGVVPVERADENEEAGRDVEEEQEEDDEEDNALLSRIDFHLLRELGNHRVTALQQFEHFGQAEHSNQLVQFADFCEPRKNCCLASAQHDDIDWQD